MKRNISVGLLTGTTFCIFLIILCQIKAVSSISLSKDQLARNIKKFCVLEKCTIILPNGTSLSLPISEFMPYVINQVDHAEENVQGHRALHRSGLKRSTNYMVNKDVEITDTKTTEDVFACRSSPSKLIATTKHTTKRTICDEIGSDEKDEIKLAPMKNANVSEVNSEKPCLKKKTKESRKQDSQGSSEETIGTTEHVKYRSTKSLFENMKIGTHFKSQDLNEPLTETTETTETGKYTTQDSTESRIKSTETGEYPRRDSKEFLVETTSTREYPTEDTNKYSDETFETTDSTIPTTNDPLDETPTTKGTIVKRSEFPTEDGTPQESLGSAILKDNEILVRDASVDPPIALADSDTNQCKAHLDDQIFDSSAFNDSNQNRTSRGIEECEDWDAPSAKDRYTDPQSSLVTSSLPGSWNPNEPPEEEQEYLETEDFQEPPWELTEEEIKEAKKMSECATQIMKAGIVCVCNRTYCDKFIPPSQTPKWTYTWYNSGKNGNRLRKQKDDFSTYKGDEEGAFIINSSITYQKIIGFGGAFTDTACKNIMDLSKETRRNLLESYFGPLGNNYNLGRVPIAGTDFSPRPYTYLDGETNTIDMFMLTEQDFKYKIPILQEAMEMTHNRLRLVGSAWTAPNWMKTFDNPTNGTLKREYWPLWADYHIKFLDQYSRNGIKFWALTCGNEAMNYYYIPFPPYINAMEWTPYEQSQWVSNYLYPMLKNSAHKKVILLAFDENREYVTFFMKYFFKDYQLQQFQDASFTHASRSYNTIAGIAVHGYMDYESNIPYLLQTKDLFPRKFLIYTETACFGTPVLGAWICAEEYANRFIENANQWVSGWIDWNLALDLQGGPTYVNNWLESTIVVDQQRDIFYKQPIFYVIAHFSKFLLPGSIRIDVKATKAHQNIFVTAARRPDDGKVIIFYNKNEQNTTVVFLIDKKYKLSLNVPGKSINSVLFW